jgi:hypothetical protein
MWFELWSGASGNLLAVYKTEADALAAALAISAVNDDVYVSGLGLIRIGGRRSAHLVAEGEALVQRARRSGATDGSSPR